jgi:hypothetical protein
MRYKYGEAVKIGFVLGLGAGFMVWLYLIF